MIAGVRPPGSETGSAPAASITADCRPPAMSLRTTADRARKAAPETEADTTGTGKVISRPATTRDVGEVMGRR